MANLLTCEGFGGLKESALATVGFDCIQARLGIVILFFIIAIVRKWGGEEIGLDFNFLFGLIGALLAYFLVVTLSGSFKIALGVGIGAGLLFGYGSGIFFGGSGE